MSTDQHVILAAIAVRADSRDDAQLTAMSLLPTPGAAVNSLLATGQVDSWWIAEDDRGDGSDNDSAVFVHPGNQKRAVDMLHAHGLTPDCNLAQGTYPHHRGWEPPEATVPGLPRDEDGELLTSATYGETHIVKVEWNTDFDGREIDPAKEDYAVTFHGPFNSEDEAVLWMDNFCPDDTDIHEITAIIMNKVRP